MFYFRIILLLTIILTYITKVNAEITVNLSTQLNKGGNLIFIRHAYAPGGGDPKNFIISDCSTQRNLNEDGRNQSIKIGQFFTQNNILIDKVLSSEWCRCKDTAKIAFEKLIKRAHFLHLMICSSSLISSFIKCFILE